MVWPKKSFSTAMTWPRRPDSPPWPADQAPEKRGRRRAGGNGERGEARRHVHRGQSRQEIVLQGAHQAHAVFQLTVALVILCLGQGTARPQIQLVGAEEAPGAEAAEVLPAVFVGDVDDLGGGGRVHRPELSQAPGGIW